MYLITMNPATKETTNSRDSGPSQRSIKARIGAPNFHSSAATIRKRAPRLISDTIAKVQMSRCTVPLAMVMTL